MMSVHLAGVSKTYGDVVKSVGLAETTLELQGGELTMLLGPSGSGKTTLLNVIAGLDSPTTGTIEVDGVHIERLGPVELTRFRRDKVGFIFQFFNLVPTLTARENVLLAAQLVGAPPSEADACLARVGLADLADRFPSELSGGQQQRVSIARALAKRPRLLLADEPTGALDHETGTSVLALLEELARDPDRVVVIVTHDEEMTRRARRILRLRDGAIVSDVRTDSRIDVSTDAEARP